MGGLGNNQVSRLYLTCIIFKVLQELQVSAASSSAGPQGDQFQAARELERASNTVGPVVDPVLNTLACASGAGEGTKFTTCPL